MAIQGQSGGTRRVKENFIRYDGHRAGFVRFAGVQQPVGSWWRFHHSVGERNRDGTWKNNEGCGST